MSLNNFKRELIRNINNEYMKSVRIIINQYNINVRNIYRKRENILSKRQQMFAEKEKTLKMLKELKDKNTLAINDILNKETLPISYINKKALLIGINYNGTPNQLNGCIEDSNSINKLLQNKGYNNIKILTDDTDIKPTRENIINELTELLKTSEEGDLIFLYYSGHGSYIRDINGDEKDMRDEVIVPLDFKLISDDELKTIIKNNMKNKTNIIAVFDCCNSGTALDLKYQYLENVNYDNIYENINYEETPGNVIFISGCRDEQYSIEYYIEGKTQGAMTWSLLNVLNKTPNISWRNLVKNIRNILKYTSYQVPQLSCGKLFNIDDEVII